MNGEQISDVLGQDEGEDFLAHEIGLSGRLFLPTEGKEVCRLVGYQRFALMIVGNMMTVKPTQYKKSRTWKEILAYVHLVRNELSLEYH